MAYELHLKKREVEDQVTLPLSTIRRLLGGTDEEVKNRLLSFFSSLREQSNYEIHDKVHLLRIINWTPEGGLPLNEAAKWMKLAKRVNDLEEDREGTFTISQFQADLIWNRMRNPQFKVNNLSGPFLEFVLHFQEVTGKHFEEEDPDLAEGENEG